MDMVEVFLSRHPFPIMAQDSFDRWADVLDCSFPVHHGDNVGGVFDERAEVALAAAHVLLGLQAFGDLAPERIGPLFYLRHHQVEGMRQLPQFVPGVLFYPRAQFSGPELFGRVAEPADRPAHPGREPQTEDYGQDDAGPSRRQYRRPENLHPALQFVQGPEEERVSRAVAQGHGHGQHLFTAQDRAERNGGFRPLPGRGDGHQFVLDYRQRTGILPRLGDHPALLEDQHVLAGEFPDLRRCRRIDAIAQHQEAE